MPLKPDNTKIIVPRMHSAILVEPSFGALQDAVNPARQAAARREFLAAAQRHARAIGAAGPDDAALDKPWVITGHQVEFYHAGVWAKVIAADELARRSGGGVAFDLLVDHDVVDHLGIDVPVKEAGGVWQRKTLRYAENEKNLAADGLMAPDGNTLRAWRQQIEHHITPSDTLKEFFGQWADGSRESHTQWLSRSRQRLEQSFGLTVHHVPTSLMCGTAAWGDFVREWCRNAAAWTDCYNRHLEAYRVRAGIKSPQHPMPNLVRSETTFELPFWLYRVGEPRHRLFVRPYKGRFFFLHEQVEHDAEAILRGESDLIVRPRALTLTMFTRLYLADVFIHGIGGALYDQITDGIMGELFGQVPAYGCVSAAWLLPLGQQAENRSEHIGGLRHRRHHAWHNPQQVIDSLSAVRTEVAELIQQRREAVEILNDHRGTLEDFRRLHALNAALHEKCPRPLARLDEQIATAERTAMQNKTLLWREYFWGMHERASLAELVKQVRGLG